MGVSGERLKYQLEQWLDLHLNKKLPSSLLLTSRALYLPEELPKEFKKFIEVLPESAVIVYISLYYHLNITYLLL